jgi:hypothetical protein
MMRRIALLTLAIGFLVPFLASAPAHAQATRTWVSGVGDDVNPCSRTAPCKTFAGAISKTAAAGEINCLDPGGFGGITITKSITLNCSATLGSVLVSGTPGITINALSTDKVILRNLQIQGLGTGTVGIRILSAATVSIENCVITQFAQDGINDGRTVGGTPGTKLFIRNTVISHNGGNGITTVASAATNRVEIVETSSINNTLIGIQIGAGGLAMIRSSVFSGNGTGIEADGSGGINMDSSQVSNNTTGVVGATNIRISNTDVTFNATGFSGTTVSYGNNRLQGNNSFGTPVQAAGGTVNNLGEQ